MQRPKRDSAPLLRRERHIGPGRMLMQPELSHWNPETAFESEESHAYYGAELRQVLRQLANHPSFVMLTFGNELACGSLGHRRMEDMLAMAHGMDGTRLYACASTPYYGWYSSMDGSDFYTATNLRQSELRATYAQMPGALNHRYPSAKSDYEGAIALTYDAALVDKGFMVDHWTIDAGIPLKTLQSWMGHSDAQMILQIYSKLTKEQEVKIGSKQKLRGRVCRKNGLYILPKD